MKKELVGKHFIAQNNVNGKKIELCHKYRGEGVNRYLKSGDVIQVIDESIEIDTPCISTLQTLHRMTKESILNTSLFIQLD